MTLAELTRSALLRECSASFARERSAITERHLQLCRIAAPTFLEGKRAEWMIEQFRAAGCEARLDRGGNVVATLDPSAKPPYVALTAHLDTVLAPRTPDDVKLDPDGTLRGPGVSDNGSGLVALLTLAKTLSAQKLPPANASILFIANVGEEGEGNLSGMRYLCLQSSLAGKIRSFIVLDGPAIENITCHALASRRFEIAYAGPGGHSWSDFGIGNPINALSRAIHIFVERAGAMDDEPRASYNFGTIQGGSTINAIATDARAKVDVRSESAQRIDWMVDLLAECVESSLRTENERASGGRITARMKEIGSRPGGRLPEDAPLLRHIQAVDAHLGIRSHLDCASTDANIPLSMNLPAISIGAGGKGGGAHTPSEWFHADGREVGLKRILLTLLLQTQE